MQLEQIFEKPNPDDYDEILPLESAEKDLVWGVLFGLVDIATWHIKIDFLAALWNSTIGNVEPVLDELTKPLEDNLGNAYGGQDYRECLQFGIENGKRKCVKWSS